ncbi:MAG TPA: hypothetical protein PKY59_06450 [Pyrinomonadaceae bacterium]|nr:hypothetical protein [Pyrinomonadaceae bacterium]
MIQTAIAQTAKTKSQNLSVKQFTASFIAELEETKDLSKISQNYFVSDFQKRFAKSAPLDIDIDEKVFDKLSESERFDFNAEFFTLGYLGLMNAFGKYDYYDNTNEETDIEAVKNLFPPSIIAQIRKSKTLNSYFLKTENGVGYNTDFKIKNTDTFRDFLEDSKKITEAQREFLNNLSPQEKAKYTKTINQLRKVTNWQKNKICGRDCEGFSAKTPYYELRYYPLYFKIIREKSNYKIFELTIGAVD